VKTYRPFMNRGRMRWLMLTSLISRPSTANVLKSDLSS
jgi:hypothetical protein